MTHELYYSKHETKDAQRRGSSTDQFSYPASLSPPNLNYTYSPERASAEALLLLNSVYSNFSSNTEKENENPAPLPITAPKPLSYAVRGKAALRSILSIGEEEEDHPKKIGIQVEETAQPVFYNVPTSILSFGLDQKFQTAQANINLHQTLNNTVEEFQQYTMVVRPISPATLMALTEPCLMAWCQELQEPPDYNSKVIDTRNFTPTPAYHFNADGNYAEVFNLE